MAKTNRDIQKKNMGQFLRMEGVFGFGLFLRGPDPQ